MAKRRHNPRSLAERLDSILPPGRHERTAKADDPRVDVAQRLSATPPPDPIRPEAKARIRSQVLAAYREQQSGGRQWHFRHMFAVRWVAAALAILAVFAMGLILRPMLSDTFQSSPNVTEELIPTDTPTPAPIESVPEALPPTASPPPAAIVIEGAIEAINANVITVFGLDIELDPDNPILTEIQPGDYVFIEGELVETGDTMKIVAVNISTTEIGSSTVDQSSMQQRSGPPIVVPPGCKITGVRTNNPSVKCPEN